MNYHPDIELLLQYSNGRLNPALSIGVGVHQQHCTDCQQRISEIESVSGDNLECESDTELSFDGFDRLMNDIEAKGSPLPENIVTSSYPGLAVAQYDVELVDKLMAKDFSQIKWKKLTSKIMESEIDIDVPDYTIKLMKLSAGAKIPKHRHRGNEFTVILQGNFKDHSGNYQQGEFVTKGTKDEHQPVAGSDGCICLAITDAPLKFSGFLGPVINWATQ